jgi:hypothetical protein
MAAVGGVLIAFVIAIFAPHATAQTTVNYKIKCKGTWDVTLTWTENGAPIGTEGPLVCVSGTPINIFIVMPANANDVEITGTLTAEPVGVLSGECVSKKSFPLAQLGKLKGQCKAQASPEGAMAKLDVFLKQP